MRVLLVEDGENDLILYRAGLEAKGIPFRKAGDPESPPIDNVDVHQINVVIATTLSEARHVLDDGTWDMVISDLKFPEEAGAPIHEHGITVVTEALRQGVRKVYLNTATNVHDIEGGIPDGVVVLPAKLTYKELGKLLQQQAVAA